MTFEFEVTCAEITNITNLTNFNERRRDQWSIFIAEYLIGLEVAHAI
jgi:hypothetical protein